MLVPATDMAVTLKDMSGLESRWSTFDAFFVSLNNYMKPLDAALIPDSKPPACFTYMLNGGSAVRLLLKLFSNWLFVMILDCSIYTQESGALVKP